MTPDITPLIPFDKDGPLQEAAERVERTTRATLFRRGGMLAAAGLAAGALATALAGAQGPSKGDIAILNFALTLEFLEAAFYKDALSGGAVKGQYRMFAEVAGEHEQAHVDALRKTLGGKATAKPSFDFGGATADQATFAQTAKTRNGQRRRGRDDHRDGQAVGHPARHRLPRPRNAKPVISARSSRSSFGHVSSRPATSSELRPTRSATATAVTGRRREGPQQDSRSAVRRHGSRTWLAAIEASAQAPTSTWRCPSTSSPSSPQHALAFCLPRAVARDRRLSGS